MALLVLGVRYTMMGCGCAAGWFMLCSEILVGAITYIVAMRLLSPALFKSVLAQLKELMNKKSCESDDS